MARKIIALLCAICLLFSLPVLSCRAAETDDLIRQMISYYRYYQEEGWGDIQRVLGELAQKDPDEAARWAMIMEGWRWINQEMPVHTGALPDGLPKDDSLCIVVMGFKLAEDGSMKQELLNRLEVALESARKYPDALLLCTGGATSPNANVTEAGQMKQWLAAAGIPEERIITETGAGSTPENAVYCYSLLQRSHPQIRSVALITSDYHVYRSMTLFFAQALLEDLPYKTVACAACTTEKAGQQEIEKQAKNLAELAGVSLEGVPKPERLVLETIAATQPEEAFLQTKATQPSQIQPTEETYPAMTETSPTEEETQSTVPAVCTPREKEMPVFALACFAGAIILALVLLMILIRTLKPKRVSKRR